MKKKLLLFSMGILLSLSLAQAQSVVINKILNTNDGSGIGDAVELLVIQDNLDMRGMILNYNAPDVPVIRFADNAIWNNLKSGTLILLIRSNAVDYDEDVDASDGILRFAIKNATTPYIEYIPGTGIGTFNFFNNSIVAIKSSGDTTPNDYTDVIHAFATGTAPTAAGVNKVAWESITAPKLWSNASLSATSGDPLARFVYPLNTTKSLADFNNVSGTAATSAGPLSGENFIKYLGLPYGLNNWDYISTLRGVTPSANNSLLFDGVDDKMIVKSSTPFVSNNNITLEAWIKVPEWKSAVYQGTIISKEEGNTSGYALRCGDNGKLNLVVGNNGGEWKEITSPAIMATDRWYHVAGVYENIDKKVTLKLFINGSLVAQSVTENSWSIKPSTTNLMIGESAAYSGRYFKGNIDEARVWTTTRTDAEIKANIDNTFPAKTAGLAAYYKFNQPFGAQVLEDNTLSNNISGNLTGFNSAAWTAGYVPSGVDLIASSLLSPDQIGFYSETSRIKASFKNLGTAATNNFTVGYQVNNGPVVTENITQPFNPGEELNYSFKQVVKGIDATSNIRIFITSPDDVHLENNELLVVYNKPINGSSDIPVFVRKLHNASAQNQTATVVLPDDNTRFKQILMNISVECPSGGCDPWDQPAKVSVDKGGIEYELARYITPYGKACGPWLVDVTSFKSILQGATDFKSYVQVWGNSGWLVNVSLTFVEGTTAFPYQKITPLWDTDNWVYGDPGKSYDLPEKTITTNALTKELEMRMTITGHGQGNTDNAAEFSDKTHKFRINGNDVQNHRLWKEDCAQNSCSNQAGTWLYPRAGWCPGQAVIPYILSLTPQLVAGQDIVVDYELQTYTNLLNTGYDGSGHTEPHYKIHSYLVEKSDVPFVNNTVNIKAESIAFPTKTADMTATTAIQVVLKNTGTTLVSSTKLYVFVDGVIKAEEIVNTPLAPGETITYTFTTPINLMSSSAGVMKTISIVSELANDEVYSDDITSITLEAPHDVLPLTFTDFNVRLTGGNTASLNWTYQNTATVSVFDVERLNEQTGEFERINSLTKSATPGQVINAFYNDELSSSGSFYYRIKHTDESGLVKYSETKVVTVADNSGVVIFPNPVEKDLNVEFKVAKAGEVKVEIFNLSGLKVFNFTKSFNEGKNQFLIPVDHLASGYYVIKIGNATFNKTMSFIKK